MPPSVPPPPPEEPDPTSPPTHAWLARWRAGDPLAFEVLEARYRRILQRRVRRHPSWPMLERHCGLDDVLQEFWAEAIDAIRHKFVDAGPGSLQGYLASIADRTVVDMARRLGAQKRGNGKERPAPTGFDTSTPKPGAASPESPTGHARTSELMQAARKVLNAREIEVWELIECEGFTAEEVALAMHETSAAIRGSLHRAKLKLLAYLGDGNHPKG